MGARGPREPTRTLPLCEESAGRTGKGQAAGCGRAGGAGLTLERGGLEEAEGAGVWREGGTVGPALVRFPSGCAEGRGRGNPGKAAL